MTINSMTAFARVTSESDFGIATWELRAVNHRYLDLSFSLPEAFLGLEMSLREIARGQLKRGRVECRLKFQPGVNCATELQLNQPLLKELLKTAAIINQQLPKPATLNALQILGWQDMLVQQEGDRQPLHNAVVLLFEKALKELLICREREGAALQNVVLKLLTAIQHEVNKVKPILPRVLLAQREKMLLKLGDIKESLDVNRLEQELVYFAQKIDVAEELSRLEIHLKEFERLLSGHDAVGKKLDFLLQELNREANTLASKSADADLTRASIEMKVFIEQIREQVQNIE